MKNICTITGASGFIGSNLTAYFSDHDTAFHTLGKERLYSVGAKDLMGSETVIHLAGIAHVNSNTLTSDDYYAINYDLTKQLFDAFLASDAEKFIFVSSVKAVADEVDGLLSEEHRPKPKTTYGLSKLLAEQYLISKAWPPEKSVYILRPCLTHGQGNKGNINLLFKVVQSGLPYPLASFENKRSFLSIKNLCFIIHEIVSRNDIPSGTYHVADDEALSTNEVVAILAEALHKKARLWNLSPKLLSSVAKLGDLFRLPLTTDRLNKLTQNYVVSNTKIKNAIGKPLPMSAEAGLRLTADSFATKA